MRKKDWCSPGKHVLYNGKKLLVLKVAEGVWLNGGVIVPRSSLNPIASTSDPEENCTTCGGAGDVHAPDGEYRGECPHCKPEYGISKDKMDYIAGGIADKLKTERPEATVETRDLPNGDKFIYYGDISLNVPEPQWVPEAGEVVELRDVGDQIKGLWGKAEIRYISNRLVVWRWEGGDLGGVECASGFHDVEIRPFKAHKERWIDAATDAIRPSENDYMSAIEAIDRVTRIYDAGLGKLPEDS